jgi:hypothetical protein
MSAIAAVAVKCAKAALNRRGKLAKWAFMLMKGRAVYAKA